MTDIYQKLPNVIQAIVDRMLHEINFRNTVISLQVVSYCRACRNELMNYVGRTYVEMYCEYKYAKKTRHQRKAWDKFIKTQKVTNNTNLICDMIEDMYSKSSMTYKLRSNGLGESCNHDQTYKQLN